MPVFTKGQALDYISSQADSIDAQHKEPNPFATSAWLLNYIENVVGEDDRLLVVNGHAQADGILLLQTLHASAHARSVSNFYTSLYTPILGGACESLRSASTLVRGLAEIRPRLATITLEPLDIASECTAQLAGALTSAGWYVRRYFRFGNLSLPCEGLDFVTYLATRDSQLRNTVQRKSKKFVGADALEIVTESSKVDAAMDEYEDIHSRSWKRPEPYPNFARGWAHACAQRGWLRLGIARLGGRAAAVQMWFVFDRRAYIFKLVYDEAQAKSSAGTVLTAHLVKHVLEVDKVREIDFLSGADAYKASWMSRRRDRIGLIACNLRSIAGLTRAAREFTSQTTARWRNGEGENWGRHAQVGTSR
jgi:hypothetical protein